jgi:YD repeat-containing protein
MTFTNFNQPILKRDAQNNVCQSSYGEVAFQGDYVMGTNLIYKGLGRPGTSTSASGWQISKLAYDGNNNITSVTWPQATNGAASSEFNFTWANRASYTYS